MSTTLPALHEIVPEIDQIGDVALRDAVVAIWDRVCEESPWDDIEGVPVSMKIRYPQVRHTQGVVRGVLALADVWREVHGVEVDRDHLIAAAVLIDVGKLVEMAPTPDGVERTPLGNLLSHASYVLHLGLLHEVPLEVLHIVATHSPNGGKEPATLEAKLIDRVDQADLDAFCPDVWTRRVVHYQP